MGIKICSRCKREKDVARFHKSRSSVCGLYAYCKECASERRKVNHSETICPICEIKFTPKKAFSLTCGDRKCINKLYRSKNKEKGLLYYQKYRLENRAKVNKQRNEYRTIRMKNDINFRITSILRKRFNNAAKGFKMKSVLKLLGCSLDDFRNHLAATFQDGMTWKNYGKWTIDHILPCAVFDLRNSEEQEICFHYSNLQALWRRDNLVKSNNVY